MGTNFVDPKDASELVTRDSLTLFYLNTPTVKNKRDKPRRLLTSTGIKIYIITFSETI